MGKRGDRHRRGGSEASGSSGAEELSLEGLEQEPPEMEILDEPDSAPEDAERRPDTGEAEKDEEAEEAGGEPQVDLLTPAEPDAEPVGISLEDSIPEPVPHLFEIAHPGADDEPEDEPSFEEASSDEPSSAPTPDRAEAGSGDGSDEEPGPDAGSAPEAAGEASGDSAAKHVEERGEDAELAGEGIAADVVDTAADVVSHHLDQARSLSLGGEHEAALEHVKLAVRSAPDRVDVLLALGATLGTLGQYDDADRELRRAQRLAPDDADVRTHLGIILFRRGLYSAAESEFRWVIERFGDHGDALFYRGEALNRLGRVDEALDCLLRATEFQPENPRIYQLMGMLYDRKALPERAGAMYRKARELARR